MINDLLVQMAYCRTLLETLRQITSVIKRKAEFILQTNYPSRRIIEQNSSEADSSVSTS